MVIGLWIANWAGIRKEIDLAINPVGMRLIVANHGTVR